MIPHRQTLINIGWPQPKSPIQTDNSTAARVTNKTIVWHRSEMMDMGFWWLCCCASHNQFRYYWDAGSMSQTNYHTKHHPDTYHEPIIVLMQDTGLWWTLKYIPSQALPMVHGFFLAGYPLLFLPTFIFFTDHYFPHIVNVAARVCISPDSQEQIVRPQIWLTYSPTPPKCSTRAIIALINNLYIIYHQH